MTLRTIIYNPAGGKEEDKTSEIDKERAVLLILSGVQSALATVKRIYIHVDLIDGSSHTYMAGDNDGDVKFN